MVTLVIGLMVFTKVVYVLIIVSIKIELNVVWEDIDMVDLKIMDLPDDDYFLMDTVMVIGLFIDIVLGI